MVELLEDIYKKDCPWLIRDLKKGERFKLFNGFTYNCISKEGVALCELDAESDFFEVAKSKIKFIAEK